MQKVEIAIRVLSICYAVGIGVMILRLQGEDTNGGATREEAKKKPDIAVATGKAVQRTQAEILAEQRERVKNLHGVGEKKLKPKVPKRKGPPSKKN
ncbi:hypothetical protein AM588_10001695 [Phytophthora nicotianae]|uniref:Uncharacterized protein n=1 Tax=Phytophthora nicotianae TaxID=4792 RepID=A0A0W8CP28_PHYNI|nr:hypothetical protein AM588_10001695 [Phytophthora nicotianae]